MLIPVWVMAKAALLKVSKKQGQQNQSTFVLFSVTHLHIADALQADMSTE